MPTGSGLLGAALGRTRLGTPARTRPGPARLRGCMGAARPSGDVRVGLLVQGPSVVWPAGSCTLLAGCLQIDPLLTHGDRRYAYTSGSAHLVFTLDSRPTSVYDFGACISCAATMK